MVSDYRGPAQDMAISSVGHSRCHNSRIIHSKQVDVEHYLQEELHHSAILGPFKSKPIYLHVMTRDKPDSQWCRTIFDLSWSCRASVNAGVQKDIYLISMFASTYPSVDKGRDSQRFLSKISYLNITTDVVLK